MKFDYKRVDDRIWNQYHNQIVMKTSSIFVSIKSIFFFFLSNVNDRLLHVRCSYNVICSSMIVICWLTRSSIVECVWIVEYLNFAITFEILTKKIDNCHRQKRRFDNNFSILCFFQRRFVIESNRSSQIQHLKSFENNIATTVSTVSKLWILMINANMMMKKRWDLRNDCIVYDRRRDTTILLIVEENFDMFE